MASHTGNLERPHRGLCEHAKKPQILLSRYGVGLRLNFPLCEGLDGVYFGVGLAYPHVQGFSVRSVSSQGRVSIFFPSPDLPISQEISCLPLVSDLSSLQMGLLLLYVADPWCF